MTSDYNTIITQLYHDVLRIEDTGIVASYIPELASVSPEKFGIHLSSNAGTSYGIGDYQEKFSVQSIVKVLSLAMAFQQYGEKLWDRVGVEPSGNPFNSLWQLEYEHGIPRNPLINSGAIVVCDMLCTLYEHPWESFISFVRKISHNPSIDANLHVARSEREIGFRNAALINMMKATGNIHNSIEQVLNLYYRQCAIEMTCEELSTTFLLFANQGKLSDGEVILTSSMTKRTNAIMQTCGFYDEAGEYTFRVGLPGKSGIGGGIVAIHPGQYAVAVWSPRLNGKGNSVKGMEFLERFTTRTGMSIF